MLITVINLQGGHYPVLIKFPDFSLTQYSRYIHFVTTQTNHNFPNFSLTNIKFLDFFRFCRWVATLLLNDILITDNANGW